MATDEERLVVSLEARVTDFEKKMKQAEQAGTQSFQKLASGSSRASRQVQQELDRAGRSVTNSTGSMIARLTSANDNIAKFGNQASAIPRQLGAATSSITAFGGALAGLAIAGLASEFISMADAAKKMESQIRLVTSSSAELSSVQEKLFHVAQASRSDYEATVGLYAKLARATKDLGLSQDQVIRTTDLINKSFKISGASADEAKNAITQLAQGLAAGALRGDEFNSVSEQAPRLLQVVADSMHKSTGEVRALAAQGKITAGVIITALGQSASKLDREFGQLNVTVGDTVGVLKNSLTHAIGELDKQTGASAGLGAGILAIANSIDTVVEHLGAIETGAKITGAVLLLVFGPEVIGAIAAVSTALVAGIGGALETVAALALANPLGAIVVGIAAAVAAAYYFRDEIDKAFGIDVVGIISDAANYIVNSFVAAYSDIGFVWANLPTIVQAAAQGAANAVISIVNSMVDLVTSKINALFQGINALSAAVGSSIKIADIASPQISELDKDFSGLEAKAKEHVQKFNDIMNTDNFAGFKGNLKGATQSAGDLDHALDHLPGTMGNVAAGAGKAGKAAKDAANDLKSFRAEADKLVEKMFPAQGALMEANKLQSQLDKFADQLTGVQKEAVTFRIQDLQKAASLGLRDLTEKTKRSGKEMADSLSETLGRTLESLFSSPIKDLDDFTNRVLSSFAKLGEQNLKKTFDSLLGDQGSATSSARDFKPNSTLGQLLGAIPGKVEKGAMQGSMKGSAIGSMNGTGNLLEGLLGQKGAGILSAGIGGAGIGYQSQSPIVGAVGGALSGWAAGAAMGSGGGPIGAIVGGASGKIGSLFNERKSA